MGIRANLITIYLSLHCTDLPSKEKKSRYRNSKRYERTMSAG
jgi:hypothetical protein